MRTTSGLSSCLVAIGIAVLLIAVATAATIAAQDSSLQQATNAFNVAQQADKALKLKPQSEQSRAETLKVINSYQRVYLITPRTSFADDSLLAIARLYESINDNRNAIKTLKFLVTDYPQSPFRKSAERDIATLSESTDAPAKTPETSADTKLDIKIDPKVDSKIDSRDVKTAEVVKESTPSKESNASARTDLKAVEKVTVNNVRYWPSEKSLRVMVDLSGEVRFKQGEARSPNRIYIDISNAHLNPSLVSKEWSVESSMLQKIRVGQYDAGTVRVVLDVGTMLRATSFTLRDPDRLIIDVVTETEAAIPATVEPAPKRITEAIPVAPTPAAVAPVPSPATVASAEAKPEIKPLAEAKAEIKPVDPGPQMASTAKPTSLGNRTLIRSLGLKVSRVVIDAGHGGKDTGSIGPTGYSEKELVLDVAKRLKTLIETEIGAEVVMTRSDDTFVPLETRTAIADSRYIRTAAIANRVSYYTTMAGCEAVVEALKHEEDLSVRSLQELHAELH